MENKEALENSQNNSWDDVAAIEAAKKLEEENIAKEEAEKKLQDEKEAAEKKAKEEAEAEAEKVAANKVSKKEKEKTKEMEIVTNVNWVQKTVKRSFIQKESTEQRRGNKREVVVEKTVFKLDEKGEVVLDKNEKPVLIREEKKIYV